MNITKIVTLLQALSIVDMLIWLYGKATDGVAWYVENTARVFAEWIWYQRVEHYVATFLNASMVVWMWNIYWLQLNIQPGTEIISLIISFINMLNESALIFLGIFLLAYMPFFVLARALIFTTRQVFNLLSWIYAHHKKVRVKYEARKAKDRDVNRLDADVWSEDTEVDYPYESDEGEVLSLHVD